MTYYCWLKTGIKPLFILHSKKVKRYLTYVFAQWGHAAKFSCPNYMMQTCAVHILWRCFQGWSPSLELSPVSSSWLRTKTHCWNHHQIISHLIFIFNSKKSLHATQLHLCSDRWRPLTSVCLKSIAKPSAIIKCNIF